MPCEHGPELRVSNVDHPLSRPPQTSSRPYSTDSLLFRGTGKIRRSELDFTQQERQIFTDSGWICQACCAQHSSHTPHTHSHCQP
ncbi:hypothetical protein GN956_G13412 [Arapaima gigas]